MSLERISWAKPQLILTLALGVLSAPTEAFGSAALCEAAATRAASETGVPVSVLRAISLTETGRRRDGKFQPWPWTINMEGAGHWFNSRDDALAYAFDGYKSGARSFDLGCFQINYRWHHQAFSSLEEMIDPEANALYAARFLARLHAELGDWSLAAGAYHSRTETYAKRYRTRFDEIHASLGEPVSAPPLAPDSSPVPRQNGFPLLVLADGTRSAGSLVPLARSSARQLFSLD